MRTDLIDQLSALGDDIDHLAPEVSPDEVRARAVSGPVAVPEPARRSPWPRRTTVVAVGAAVGVAASLVAIVMVVGDDDGQRLRPASSEAPPPTAGPTQASTPTSPSTSPPTSPPTSVEAVTRGDSGPVVQRVEEALAGLGYEPGAIDGVFDAATEQAVWAFEALSLGRRWQDQTGSLRADEVARLLDGTVNAPVPQRSRAGTHVEIDLVGQTVLVVRDDTVVFVAHASTGSGEQWCETTITDVDVAGRPVAPTETSLCGVATTPGGVFEVHRVADGRFASPLGGMSDPAFFNYSVAVHGAVNVPPLPVSHGAVRIPLDRIAEFRSLVSVGDTVYVFDGVTRPEDLGAQSPMFPWLDPDAAG